MRMFSYLTRFTPKNIKPCTPFFQAGILLTFLCFTVELYADNPLVTHIYTADPTARVFNDTLYIYPSHDIEEHDGLKGHNDFMMEDYHVFSTTDLINYTDHGVILHQDQISWIEKNSFEMWAPDCHTKNGRYYFYFPAQSQVGVAIANHPTGPFDPLGHPIKNAEGIDPNCFIDDDGTPYLFFGHGEYLKGMQLKENMVEGTTDPVKIRDLPMKYKEGSFVFKRNGTYYFTFPINESGKEEIAYATGNHPLGPYSYRGVIMDKWPDCWTNHHSIVEWQDQWYFFYHYKDLSGDGTLRNMRAEKLFFNDDGSIQKVYPTRRGIGIRKASEKIQVDRYSEGSPNLKTPVIDTSEPAGFCVAGITNGSWLTYPDVDFENSPFISINARVACAGNGGSITIYRGNTNGVLLGTIKVAPTGGKTIWKTFSTSADIHINSIENIVLVFEGDPENTDLFRINWLRFE